MEGQRQTWAASAAGSWTMWARREMVDFEAIWKGKYFSLLWLL